MRALWLLLLVTATLMASCGPSLRRSHRASAYFEECYAADLDRLVSDTERRACWQAWSRGYLVGASPERMDYVHERLAMLDPDRAAAIALATGDDGAVDTIDETDTPADVAETDVPAPMPDLVDPAAPPIPTASEAAPPDTNADQQATDARHLRTHERHLHRGIVAPSTQTASCPCEAGWQTCSARCLADDHGCIGACRREHSLCSRSCY